MKDGITEMPKVFVKDIRDIRNGLMPEVVTQPVHVHCIAVHNDEAKNTELRLNLHRCVPIEGYSYNNVTDKYAVICYDAIYLGSIPVSYRLKMGSIGNWTIAVPMPEAVLKRYMTPDQRRSLAHFKMAMRPLAQDVRYEYIQMLSAYPYG